MAWFQQRKNPETPKRPQETPVTPRVLAFPTTPGERRTTMHYLGPVPMTPDGESDFETLRERERSVMSAQSLNSEPSIPEGMPDLSSLHLRNRRRDRDRAMRKHHKVTWGLSSQAEDVLEKQKVAPTSENLLVAAFSCLSINYLKHFDHDYSRPRPR